MMNPNLGLSMVSEHSHPLDGAFPDSTSNNLLEQMMALMVKWRAEDKERSMKWEAETQEHQHRYQSTSPQMMMRSDLDPVVKTLVKTSTEDLDLVEKTHKPSGHFVEQMVCDSPDKALDGDRVNRKLRDDLRWDSLKLTIEFSKLLYGKSQAHKAFIPKRFEDLKPKGGIRFRRILIKLNYHRSRFKKSKSPRRTLDLADSLDRTGTGLAISQRCVRVKTVRMKKQDHRGKRTTQVKLAQACKSLGMFLDSPSFRNPKEYMQIRLDKKQISDTGLKRESHHFVYGFTFLALMEIDSHVDTWIGDQSIFAEEVIALEHDDNADAMESLKDETILESESKSTSKYKSQAEFSRVPQQKEQQQVFHKVRFKCGSHRRSKFKAWKKESRGNGFVLVTVVRIHNIEGVKLQRILRERLRELSCVQKKYKVKKVSSRSVAHLNNGVNHSKQSVKVRKLVVWDPGVTGFGKNQEEELRHWKMGLKIIKLCRRLGFNSFRISRSGKMWLWWLMKTSLRKQLLMLYLTSQVWEPGIVCYGIKNKKLKSDCKFLGLRVHKVKHKLLPLVSNASVRGVRKREVVVQLVQCECKEQTRLLVVYGFVLQGFGHVQGSVKDTKVLTFDPGGASGEKAQELTFDKGGLVTLTMASDFYQLEDKLVLKPGSMHKNTENIVIGYVWDPGRSVLAYDVASIDDRKTRDGSYQQQGQLHLPRPPEQNRNKSELVTIASDFHQLEDKLVLHRGSIDNSKNLLVKDFRMETRCFSASAELDMIDGELRPFGVVWLAGTLALSDYMRKIYVTAQAAFYRVLVLLKQMSLSCEAGIMALIKSERGSDGDTSGWKRYMRYSMNTDIYDVEVGYIMSLPLVMIQVFYKQVKGGEVVVRALRQTLHFTQEWFHLPRPPELYTKGGNGVQ